MRIVPIINDWAVQVPRDQKKCLKRKEEKKRRGPWDKALFIDFENCAASLFFYRNWSSSPRLAWLLSLLFKDRPRLVPSSTALHFDRSLPLPLLAVSPVSHHLRSPITTSLPHSSSKIFS